MSNPPSLLAFLHQCRQLLQHSTGKQRPVLVIGNPSADLDSFACAVLYAFFHSSQSRPHIPILNVPFPSSDLHRQRPEFATALAVRKRGYYAEGWTEHRKRLDGQEFKADDDGGLLKEVTTRHDFQESSRSYNAESDDSSTIDAVLVDWNSLAGDSSPAAFSTSTVSVFGCVDHHIDEHFVPDHTSQSQTSMTYSPPRVIQNAGSCTSLVMQHVRDSSLWTYSPVYHSAEITPYEIEAQTIQLALAAILVDTANLKDESKITTADSEAVELLTKTMGPAWDREKFYTEVKTAKQRGLELLSVEEVLSKDYKQWDVSTSSEGGEDRQDEKLGIASVVLPLKTLKSRSESSSFFSTLHSFAESHSLSVFLVMTTSTSQAGDFQRELLLLALTSTAAQRLSSFVESEYAKQELGLEEWSDVKDFGGGDDKEGTWRRIYWQRDVSKSRKQIAPLFRRALGDASVGKG